MDALLALFKQLIKYASAAFIGGIIDYGLLILLVEVFDVHYMPASLVSLLAAMTAQFFLNNRYVFDTSKEHMIRKYIGYIILGAFGIGLNMLIIFTVVHGLGQHYIVGKVCASVLVGIYNFVSRKLYLEKRYADEGGEA